MSTVPTVPLHELQPILPDHPTVRAALWHLDGLRQEGMDPALWFTERECAEVAAYGHERRRREWMAARIALKRLLIQEGVVRSPFHAEVRKNDLGQPRVVVYVPDTGHYAEYLCSLAHKNQLVVAAYSLRHVRVGIDIERRSWRFPHLRRRFECPTDTLLATHDSIARFTVLWAFKEAVSKLVGLGFACGFTQIACRETRFGICEIEAPDDLHLHGIYLWHDRYAVAIVTDTVHELSEDAHPARNASRPWFEQVARAQRLRRLRRARGVATSPHNHVQDLPEPEDELAAAATEGRPPPRNL